MEEGCQAGGLDRYAAKAILDAAVRTDIKGEMSGKGSETYSHA